MEQNLCKFSRSSVEMMMMIDTFFVPWRRQKRRRDRFCVQNNKIEKYLMRQLSL